MAGPTIATRLRGLLYGLPDVGSFSGSLTSPKRERAYAGQRWILGDLGAVGGWSERIRNSRYVIVRDRVMSPGTPQSCPVRSGGAGSLSLRCLCRCPSFWFNAARRRAPACWPPTRATPLPPATVSRTASRNRNSTTASRPRAKACVQRQVAARPAAAQGTRPSRSGSRRSTPTLTLPQADRARRTDHAGQHEILRLPLFRQQSALRSAVPQHLQGRPPRPPQLWRPRLLAGRDLQRQPRAGARPRELRCPQARRDRGVLPRQRRDAGARRARPPTGAAADFGFRRQRRAAGAAAGGRCRRFQRRQILAARRLQALHG